MILFLTEKIPCLILNGADSGLSTDNWSPATNMLGQFFLALFALAFVIFLAYYATKLMGRGVKGLKKGANLEVIEVIGIGIGQSLMIARAGDKYFLLAATKDRVTAVTEMDKDSIDLSSKDFKPFSIDEYFGKLRRKNGGKNE